MARRRLRNFRQIKRGLASLGITWAPASGKGSHGSFIGPHQQTGTSHSYPIPRHQQREINIDYINGLRRRFGLEDKDHDSLFD